MLGDGRTRLNNHRSGSVRPKNLRFRIGIRIHNTEGNVLKSIGHLQSEQKNVVAALILQCKLHSRLHNTVRSTEGHLIIFRPLPTFLKSFFTFYPHLPLVFSASFFTSLSLCTAMKGRCESNIKGIDRPFQGGVKSSLIRSLFINWRLGNFFLSLILKGFHHKISKKPKDAA